jgi:urease accessory protein
MHKCVKLIPRALIGRTYKASDTIVMDHHARLVRRKVFETTSGVSFLVSLEKPVSMLHGDAFLLDNGAVVEVIAAHEPLLKASTPNQLRLMEALWHIGNRHTPCMIEEDAFYIELDPVLEEMLKMRGLAVTHVSHPFEPQRGAYHQH